MMETAVALPQMQVTVPKCHQIVKTMPIPPLPSGALKSMDVKTGSKKP